LPAKWRETSRSVDFLGRRTRKAEPKRVLNKIDSWYWVVLFEWNGACICD
jgi:hypothetical protein